ncbi:MAG: fumarylacetoacetate hydrolase family protein, partial [Gemmatimonadota bacterium]|nr:fumarylacetoacetate hydrolase family protein [Gemmatimonadota bacterium]
GRRASHVDEADALGYVDALVAANDVTARDLQRKDDQWTRAKGFDTFCPVGEPESIEGVDVDALQVVTRVNGEERQRGLVSDMAFGPAHCVSYISRIMTLEPGDLILTGTPEGIGPLFDGDEVEVEIAGITHVVNPVRTREDARSDHSTR